MRYQKIILALVAVLFVVGVGLYMTRDERLQASAFAPFDCPELVFETLRGEPVRLDPARHEVTVLLFWASWCEACKHDLNLLAELADSASFGGVGFYAISKDQDRASLERAISDLDLSDGLMVLRDAGNKVAPLFEVNAVPETFIVTREGRVTRRFIGALAAEPSRFLYELGATRSAVAQRD